MSKEACHMVKETYYTHKRDLQIYWHTLAVFRDGALVGLELLVLGGFRAPRAAAAFLFLFHQPPGRVGRDYCAALLYTYIHIYIYMYTYVYTQSHTHTFTHTQSHTHTHTHTHSHTHTHTHTRQFAPTGHARQPGSRSVGPASGESE